MSSINYLICQQCQINIPLIIFFFDVEGLKIEYKCKCLNECNVITAKEFIKRMIYKRDKIKGNCQKDKNHGNILGQIYCYDCKKVLCRECNSNHFNEYNIIHKKISNDINKVLKNKNHFEKKSIFEEKNIEKLKEQIIKLKEYIEIKNKRYYDEIVNEIKASKDNKLIGYQTILAKSFNFNKSINDLIISIFEILKDNFNHLKEYSLEEPSKNLFTNFIINEKLKFFFEKNNNNKNKSLLEKISLFNEYLLNNFIIKKKLIFPEISCLATCKGHSSSIDCIIQLYDGRIATGSSDGSVKIWDSNNFNLIKTLKINMQKNPDPIYSINQMKNKFLVYGTEGGNFIIWDINKYQIICFVKNCHSKSIWGFMNVGKNKLVSISEDGTFKVWNINNFKLIKTINVNEGMILSEWTAEDGNLITGLENGKILIWDMNNYTCKNEFIGHELGVDYIIQLSDYRIVSGAQDMKLKIWDYFTCKCLKTLIGHKDKIESLLELNDTRIISASWDKTFKIWDVYNYQCLLTINAHNDYILVIELLNNGKFSSGSADNTLKIWNTLYNNNQIIQIND